MPCNDGPGCYSPSCSECPILEKRLNEVTNLLCLQCKKLDKLGENHLHPDVSKWWKVHKEWDKKREKEEKADRERNKQSKLKQLDRLRQELKEEYGLENV